MTLTLRSDDGSLYALKSYRSRPSGRLRLRNEVKWLTHCTNRVPAPEVVCWSETGEWLIMDYVRGDSAYDLAEVENPGNLGRRLGRWLASFHSLGPITSVSVRLTPSLSELYDRGCEDMLFRPGVGQRFRRLREEVSYKVPSEPGSTTRTVLKSDCQAFHFIVSGDVIFGIDFEEAGALGDAAMDLGQLAASYLSVAPAQYWKPFLNGLVLGWGDGIGRGLPDTLGYWLAWYWLYLQTLGPTEAAAFYVNHFPTIEQCGPPTDPGPFRPENRPWR